MRLLDGSGNSILTTGLPVSTPSWHDCGVAWTCSWDAADAELYTPSAGEQSEYGVSASPRVLRIPGKGSGEDLVRDDGTRGALYGMSNALPGPAWIPSSRRFNRHAAVFCDEVLVTPVYATLGTLTDINTTTQYLNGGAGYQAPYWVAVMGRAAGTNEAIFDSALGSDTAINAGPTIAWGNQAGTGTDWSAGTWWDDGAGLAPDPTFAGGVLRSSRTASSSESVLIMVQVTRGTNAAKIYVAWKDSSNVLQTTNVAGTCALDSVSTYFRDAFVGWVHSSYLSTAGFVQGTIGLADIAALNAWAAPRLPPLGVEITEP